MHYKCYTVFWPESTYSVTDYTHFHDHILTINDRLKVNSDTLFLISELLGASRDYMTFVVISALESEPPPIFTRNVSNKVD